MRFWLAILILAATIMAGCDQASMMKGIVPPGAESTAKGYIDLLRQNKFEQIERDFDPSIKSNETRSTLADMAKAIPNMQPKSIKLVGAHTFRSTDITTTNITYEYEFKGCWLLINVATQDKKGVVSVVGFHVNQIQDSLENINKFKLRGKSPLQYATLSLAILFVLFTLYTLVLCAKTKIENKKWLWIIFILFGLAKFSIDWTTGQWNLFPLSLQLFSASAFAPLYGPWVISISMPLGAVIFILKRKKLSKRQGPTEPLADIAIETDNWRI